MLTNVVWAINSMAYLNQNPELPIVYLDMDGVLADFDARVMELYMRENDMIFPLTKNKSWALVNNDHEFFKNLPPISSGVLLAKWLVTYSELTQKFRVGIMSATGDGKEAVASQKYGWLKEQLTWPYEPSRFFTAPVVFVKSGTDKFVRPQDILIDDTQAVVDSVREKGGQAILFKPNRHCILEIQEKISGLPHLT